MKNSFNRFLDRMEKKDIVIDFAEYHGNYYEGCVSDDSNHHKFYKGTEEEVKKKIRNRAKYLLLKRKLLKEK